MKNKWVVALIVPALFVSSGCATIVSGTTQKVSLSSQPSGADAKADGNITVKTPAIITLDRKLDHTIEFSKEGYKTATVFVRRAFNEMATGNILLGGIIGAGIDAASGSGNKLIPERIDLALEAGSGYSDVPKFSSEKDQEFYEKNVLKQKLESNKKVMERVDNKAAEASPSIETAAGQMAPTNATAANFSPKVR